MEDDKESSSTNTEPHFEPDNVESPIVTLTTPFPQSAIRTHAATLRKLQEAEKELKAQQRKIQELTFNIEIQDAHLENLRHAATISRDPSVPPATTATTETPGPHRLQLKPERPEDIAYKEKLEAQESAEKAMGTQESEAGSKEDEMMTIFRSLTKVLKDNNQHLQSSDVTDPTKFNGLDTQWEDFYLQFRTFLEAKGWLTTFDHPTGPGTPGFDNDVNKKIYNKLLALCRKGTAATYITKAAASNGWEAGKYLKDRYEGFSKQRANSLKNLVENIRHIHGTNMQRHIDKFERICGMMAHNDPLHPPTDEQKVDWFLDSVTEKTYDSVHTNCTDKQLDGTLTFARVVKLYTHRCFQKYPHFQLDDLTNDKKELSNNATTFHYPHHDKGKGKDKKGKGRQMGKGRGRGRDNSDRNRQNSRPNHNRPKGKGKGRQQKGQSPTDPRTLGDRKPKEPCSYCGGENHTARTCYKRQNDEKNAKTSTTHKQANLNVQIDEQALMFSQTVLTVSLSDSLPEPDTNRWGESENGQDQTTTDSDQEKDSTEESKAETISEKDYEEWKEDPWHYTEEGQESEQHPQSWREEDNEKGKERASLTELNSSLKEKETFPTKEQDANQSSSVEPTWGQWREKTEQELSDEWKEWEETNQGSSTQAYRHGRCQLCAKPVSTTNINPTTELTCYECRKFTAENEREGYVNGKQKLKKAYKDDEEEGGADRKQGCDKTEKDDEEEWGRIPIPQSDDSDESEFWNEPEEDDDSTEELKICCLSIHPREDKPTGMEEKEYKKMEEDLAFLIGPRRHGIVRTKDGILLTLQEDSTP